MAKLQVNWYYLERKYIPFGVHHNICKYTQTDPCVIKVHFGAYFSTQFSFNLYLFDYSAYTKYI